MWALENETAYGAERNWTRDKAGVHHWVVAVKASFDIRPDGALALADRQVPPLLAPEYHGEPGASSLRLDSDLLAIKPCTDVILDACAHAPRGRRATMVPVSCRFGTVNKSLAVHGQRTYYKSATGSLSISSPHPFEKFPIRYEHAYGGIDTTDRDPSRHAFESRNPIGVGFSRSPDRLANSPAPSVEYPNSDSAKVGPAGFGPIDPSWSPRREYAGTYDAGWERNKKPLLPDDYNELFASSAPNDQRLEQFMRGGERIELTNLTPEGLLRLELPKIYLTFTSHFGRRQDEHRAKLTSVILELEQMKLGMVWQSTLKVSPRDDEYLDKTVINEKAYL